jgi:CRP-like cAMP-binding protein
MNLSKNLKKGEIIFHEGNPSDCAYIIGMGSIEIFTTTPKGKKILGVLGENEIFGEMGLIDGLSRSASAKTREESVIYTIAPETFEQLVQKNPKALVPILKILTNRLRGTISYLNQDFKLPRTN